jgi:hypothetical protein
MSTITVVNIIPNSHSNETNQDSEPSIAVNPMNPNEIVITAFTPPDSGQSNGPIFYSNDGGATWFLNFIIPNGGPDDQSIGFASISNELYLSALHGNPTSFNVMRTSDPTAIGTLPTYDARTDIDQPWVEAITVIGGPDDGKDRLYVAYNDDGVSSGKTATIDVCPDALASSPVFTQVPLETRSVGSGLRDGYAIRPVAHRDGTIYAIYEGWRSGSFGGNITTDIVVVRDDSWGTGSTPFTDLKDPGDHLAGIRVATGVVINDGGFIGQERLNNDLIIAVNPSNSDIVYIAWADNAGPNYTIRVRRSLNRGVMWSGDLLTADSATMTSMTINSTGKVGLLYQKVNSGNWETHFQSTTDSSGTHWDDAILSVASSTTPAKIYDPYLGDWARVVAVGKNFYGTFCANNTPDPANFPSGITFLRNHSTTSPFQLLGSDNATPVAVSIDPFFFNVQAVAASADFYVRDWTDSATSGDNGAEPSTHAVFYTTSDVWNQSSSSTPNPPNANDQPDSEDASAGSGSAGDNYLFARIRRNVLPAAGSGATTVSAHFLVSEFGTGSNFIDWTLADASDPDITFPVVGDVTVSFAETDLGPIVTPPYQWNLNTTASNHLCVAVEIYTSQDPFVSPGLTGHAPGWPTTDLAVLYDNNKAQRNLQVYLAGHGSHGSTYYGIAHNAATLTRDMVLQAGALPGRNIQVEVVTGKGIVERKNLLQGDNITLTGMLPGENRWIGITIPVPAAGSDNLTVPISELNGATLINGFAIAAQPATLNDTIASVLAFEKSVLLRIAAAFQIKSASTLAKADDPSKQKSKGETTFLFDEKIKVSTKDLTIEMDLKISKTGESSGEEKNIAYGSSLISRIAEIEIVVKELISIGKTGDPFSVLGTLAAIAGTSASDELTLVTLHATLLNRLDAFMTMQQKAAGDVADIVQNVTWQRELFKTRPTLTAMAAASEIRIRSGAYLNKVANRTALPGDYRQLISDLGPYFEQVVNILLAKGIDLRSYVQQMNAAVTTRSLQQAHRQFLLQLQHI